MSGFFMKHLKIAVLMCLSLFLVTSSVVYAQTPKGGPFTEIWNAITKLQNDLKNIQLLPGPQGQTGPEGPQGPVGPQGEPGTVLTTTSTTTGIDSAKTISNSGIIIRTALWLPENEVYYFRIFNPNIHNDSNIFAEVFSDSSSSGDLRIMKVVPEEGDVQLTIFEAPTGLGDSGQGTVFNGDLMIHYLILN